MKKQFLLYLILFNSIIWAQSQNNETKNTTKLNKWKFLEVLETNPKIQQEYLLENGKSYTKNYLDSIYKTKDSFKFTQEYLLDSLQNKITVLLRKRTDAEMKETNKQFAEYQDKDQSNRKKLRGSTINDLNFKDINGKNYTSNDLLGKIVVLNFWFTKCGPCIKEMPDLNKLKEKYGDENVVYLAITYDKNDIVEKFLTKKQLDFIIVPNEQKTIDKIGVSFFPTNMVLDKNGKVIFVNELWGGNGIDKIDKIIKKQLKKNT